MGYVSFLKGVKWDASGHGNVCYGFGAETQAYEGGGNTGKHHSGLQGLRENLVDVEGI